MDKKTLLYVGELNLLPKSSDFTAEGNFFHLESLNRLDTDNFPKTVDILVISIAQCPRDAESILLKIYEQNTNIRIIILAHMYEEPLALRIVGAKCLEHLNCEYYVLPLHPDEFKAILSGDESLKELASNSTENKDAHIRMLEKLATEDDLTKVKNRRYIREFLRQIIARAAKENMQVTVLIFDIDNFKHYNDTYGHQVGDKILAEAARLMRKCCRPQDVVARIGGDEFAVVFWDNINENVSSTDERRSVESHHPKEPIDIANRYLAELNTAEFSVLGKRGNGTLAVSGGLATFPVDGNTVGELFTAADNALLEAKRTGKNKVLLIEGGQ